MTSLHWLRGAGSGPPYTPTHSPPSPASLPPSLPPRVSLSSLAHPHFDKRDTEFIRRLRSNCLQAIFTLFAFITSLMRLIMGLLCGAAPCFSPRLPVCRWSALHLHRSSHSPHTHFFFFLTFVFFYFHRFIFIYFSFSIYQIIRFSIVYFHVIPHCVFH